MQDRIIHQREIERGYTVGVKEHKISGTDIVAYQAFLSDTYTAQVYELCAHNVRERRVFTRAEADAICDDWERHYSPCGKLKREMEL